MEAQPENRLPFLVQHPSDRNFFASYVAIIWAAIVLGFGLDSFKKFNAGKLDYPWPVHAHALIFGGWLLLFTAQVLAIRSGNVARHRRTGRLALAFLPLMLVAGPWASLAMDGLKFGHPKIAFPFMAIQFTNVIGAGVLIAAGIIKRGDAAAHKRLMLMSILVLTEPGLSRIYAHNLSDLLGEGLWQFWVTTYVGTFILMVGVGAYDLATRGRLHSVYVAAFAWALFTEFLATWLYYAPWWSAVTTGLLGH